MRRFVWLCTKSTCSESSLCNLCVLCDSVVSFCSEFINHRDTEDTEIAQRRATETFRAKPVCLLRRVFNQRLGDLD